MSRRGGGYSGGWALKLRLERLGYLWSMKYGVCCIIGCNVAYWNFGPIIYDRIKFTESKQVSPSLLAKLKCKHCN